MQKWFGSVWILYCLGREGPFLVVLVQRKNICPCLVSLSLLPHSPSWPEKLCWLFTLIVNEMLDKQENNICIDVILEVERNVIRKWDRPWLLSWKRLAGTCT